MDPFLHHEAFDLWPDGEADFRGGIDSYQKYAFTGIAAYFAGRVAGMAHGITSLVPTDVASTISEPTLDEGGICLSGFNASSGANKTAVRLWGYAKLASDAIASIELRASKKSGTSATALAAYELILGICNDVGDYLLAVRGDGRLVSTCPTDSTGYGTGALVLAGGLGVAKGLAVGGAFGCNGQLPTASYTLGAAAGNIYGENERALLNAIRACLILDGLGTA